jgi:hypothetical protein
MIVCDLSCSFLFSIVLCCLALRCVALNCVVFLFCGVALLFFVLSCSVLLCFVLHFIPSSCIPLYSYLRYPLSLQAALDGQDTHDQRGVGTEKKEDRREDERSGEKRTEGGRERRGQEGRGEKREERGES